MLPRRVLSAVTITVAIIRPVVASIPATGSGVRCLGPCKVKWCRVSWRGIVGWTNMHFLGE